MNTETGDRQVLSSQLPGTWELESRIDITASGQKHPEPALGEDPIALLIYDRSGHFAAQFMKRDRSVTAPDGLAVGQQNNSRAQGGYDAYFGTYTVNDANGTVTQCLIGALSKENVGAVLTRETSLVGSKLVIQLQTKVDGVSVTRTLTWKRVG